MFVLLLSRSIDVDHHYTSLALSSSRRGTGRAAAAVALCVSAADCYSSIRRRHRGDGRRHVYASVRGRLRLAIVGPLMLHCLLRRPLHTHSVNTRVSESGSTRCHPLCRSLGLLSNEKTKNYQIQYICRYLKKISTTTLAATNRWAADRENKRHGRLEPCCRRVGDINVVA